MRHTVGYILCLYGWQRGDVLGMKTSLPLISAERGLKTSLRHHDTTTISTTGLARYDTSSQKRITWPLERYPPSDAIS
ncbi:hypothetical protein VTJ04DRAFT_5926 [Mycothermus thermophilus]|uniref:uncharacterized protein n=1 Tax=Humicola insolens TaxID=85995 RepID=UPI003742E299